MQASVNGKFNPVLVWAVALGAGASGVTGIGSMAQLGQLHETAIEQARVAELRGQFMSQIQSNRELINANSQSIQAMMPKEGIIRLHDAQQALIDKLIEWTGGTVTKDELQLAIGKMKAIKEQACP